MDVKKFVNENKHILAASFLMLFLGLVIGVGVGEDSGKTLVKVQCDSNNTQMMTLAGFIDYTLALQFPPSVWVGIIIGIIFIIKM